MRTVKQLREDFDKQTKRDNITILLVALFVCSIISFNMWYDYTRDAEITELQTQLTECQAN